MNVRLKLYQVLLFKFGCHLCKGSIERTLSMFHIILTIEGGG